MEKKTDESMVLEEYHIYLYSCIYTKMCQLNIFFIDHLGRLDNLPKLILRNPAFPQI